MSELNINEDAQSGGEGSCSATQPTSESAFPDEDEETITMLDVIEREDKLEQEMSAVLGYSDEKNCTYPKGYIARQALYSCATCSEGTDKVAAICLACSLECHENHEVYELYTKRNYRCDCGNSKFKPEFECKLIEKQQKKSTSNEKNKYNHNFSGRYCTCDKRFPPDECDNSSESNDDMLQCIVCEDWFHSRHLNAKEIPVKFDELICGQCVEKLDFVHHYKNLNTETICESDTNDSQTENKDPERGISSTSSNSASKNGDQTKCVLEELKKEIQTEATMGPMFWSDCSWRAKLCRCQNCLDMYKAKECEYLLDEKDTVQYYEARGRELAKNSESPFDRGMSALNRMNRVAVAEALHGYDELKADLSDYLRKFADSKKVVREQDIHEFFQQLKHKKRPRLDE